MDWLFDSSILMSLVIIVLITSIILLIVSTINYRAPIEIGKIPIYKTMVGGHFNLVSSSFTGLRLYKDFLILSPLETYVLPYSDIDEVRVYKMLGLEVGVEIKHRNPHIYSKVLHLSATNPRRIVEVIRQGLQQ